MAKKKKCGECGKKFADIEEHMAEAHGGDSGEPPEEKPQRKPKGKPKPRHQPRVADHVSG